MDNVPAAADLHAQGLLARRRAYREDVARDGISVAKDKDASHALGQRHGALSDEIVAGNVVYKDIPTRRSRIRDVGGLDRIRRALEPDGGVAGFYGDGALIDQAAGSARPKDAAAAADLRRGA